MADHPLTQFFTFAHLRDEKLQAVSRTYAELAQRTLELCPDNGQRDEALKKLLEAKDCAVRAMLFKAPLLVGSIGEAVQIARARGELPDRPAKPIDVPDPKPTAPG